MTPPSPPAAVEAPRVDLWIERLAADDPRMRKQAIDQLKVLAPEGRESIPLLLDILRSPEDPLRTYAVPTVCLGARADGP